MNLKQLLTGLGLLLLTSNIQADCCPVESADYVIVGAGTAGCVLANKLSEKHSVIVLDGGQDHIIDPNTLVDKTNLITDPAQQGNINQYLNNVSWGLGHWVPVAGSGGAQSRQLLQAGKMLGGSSAINTMVYVRGDTNFFNRLATLTGDSAWGPANAESVFNSFETFTGVVGFTGAARGTTGPLAVQQAESNATLAAAFTTACTTASGLPAVKDYNDFTSSYGPFRYVQYTITQDTKRAYSYSTFLQGLLTKASTNLFTGRNGKLKLYMRTFATRIMFCKNGCKDPKATGVLAMVAGEQKLFTAKKKVIIAAGVQSPLILQYSGIGDGSDLVNNGVPVLVDNPYVGKNLYNACFTELTGTGVNWGASDANFPFSGGAFLEDPTTTGAGNRGIQLLCNTSDPTTARITIDLINPTSEGNIELDLSNPRRMPFWKYNYMLTQHDIDTMFEGFNVAWHTLNNIPGVTPAGTQPDLNATTINTTKIALRDAQRSAYYIVGTCAMGQSAATGGVVDSSGNVFGVSNLVVADCSICPIPFAGATQGMAYLIGHIIADKLLK